MTVSIDAQIDAMVKRCSDWLRRRDELRQESQEIVDDTIALAERVKREEPHHAAMIDMTLVALRRALEDTKHG